MNSHKSFGVTHNNRYDSANAGRSQRAFPHNIWYVRLDQPSYWDSWKLVGRLWRDDHESWM